MSFQINSPLPSSLASECRKASRILNGFINPGQGLDTIIPPGILANCKGLAIYSVLKAGFLFSGRAGSGLVIARLPDGSWSAPAAIGTAGMGFGGQVGAELTDFVMVLNTTAAVKTFMHHGSITLGGNISVAAGPIGRNAEASGTASIKSVAAVYSYSKTRGVFAGVSLEGSVIIERFDANAKMYGRKVATRDLLNGTIPPPPQADPLYRALEVRFHGAGGGNTFASSAAGGRFAFMNGSNDSGFGSGRGLGRSGTMYNTEPVYEDSFRGGNNDRSDYSRGGVHRAATTGGYGGGYSANRGGGGGLGDTYGSSNRSFDDSPSSFRDTTWENRNSNEIRARALFNFSKQQDGDLPFRKGDIITIIKRTDTQHDWWTGRLNSETGIFPANFVEII